MAITETERLPVCPQSTVDLIMDCDTYNEIDDQFAIAYALKNPQRLNILGFTCAPFRKATRAATIAEGIGKSYEETCKVLTLCGASDRVGRVYRGATAFLPDEQHAVDSAAARFIVEQSRGYTAERPLYLVASGAITNVASALLLDPSLAGRVVIVWLGGAALNWWHNDEYNMKQDVAAARVVLGCAAPFVQIPAQGVASQLSTTFYELEHFLKGKNKLCDYLFANSVEYVTRKNHHKAWSKVIWDIAAPAWLLNDGDRFMCGRVESRYLPEYGTKRYEATPIDRKMYYVHEIFRDELMDDMFDKLAGNEHEKSDMPCC